MAFLFIDPLTFYILCYNIWMNHKQLDGLRVGALILAVMGVLLHAISGIMWYRYVYMDEDRVFWSAIENSLSTKGVQKVINTSKGDVEQVQTVNLYFSPTIKSQSLVTYTDSADKKTSTEMVADFSSDYARYASLETYTNTEGILGVWAKTSQETTKESQVLLSQLASGALVFVGNLSSGQRDELIELMKSTSMYEVIGKSGTNQYGNKTADVYKVRINLEGYNAVLSRYLTMLGFTEAAASVVQADSETTVPIFELAIDAKTRTIFEAGFPEIGSIGGEQFNNWGVTRAVDIPVDTITVDELQKRLETIYTATEME